MNAESLSKVAHLAVVAAAVCCSVGASAAPCRSQTAASAGSANGYNIDIQAADVQEQQDKSASDILGQCVAGITGVMTIPTFPTLDEILNQIKNEICRIASQEVHQAVGNVSAEINSALQSVPRSGGPITVTPTSVSSGNGNTSSLSVTTTPGTTTNSNWLSRTWR